MSGQQTFENRKSVVILKTRNSCGRVVRRVAVVENPERLQSEFTSWVDLMVNFFENISKQFSGGLSQESVAEMSGFVINRLGSKELCGHDELVRSVRIAQVLGRMLDTFSVLPVFYTDEDAELEAVTIGVEAGLINWSEQEVPYDEVDMSVIATCSYRPAKIVRPTLPAANDNDVGGHPGE